MKKRAAVALLLLAGCSNEKALDPHVGQIVLKEHAAGYESCTTTMQTYDGKTYMPVMNCSWVPDNWSFTVDWEPQRFEDNDSHKVRVEPAERDDTDVSEDTYNRCNAGDWFNETTGACNTSHEAVG